MSNSAHTLNPNQGQKDQYTNQSNPTPKDQAATGAVTGKNDANAKSTVSKDEPSSQNRTGGMKDEANCASSCASDDKSVQGARKTNM